MLQEVATISRTAVFSARELLRSDPFAEAAIRAFKTHPLQAIGLLPALIFARTPARDLPSAAAFDASTLLYDKAVLERLREAMQRGLRIELICDMPSYWCAEIARYLGLDEHNALIERGETPGLRSGNLDTCRLPAARKASAAGLIARALRLYQWPKNVLIFLPILLAHRLDEVNLVFASLLAFLALGFGASAIYVVNDLMDIDADRAHPVKRARPFASGALGVRWGLLLVAVCVASCALLAAQLPGEFALCIAAYFALNTAYTFYLKRKLLVDVLALAAGYTLRILAGNAATEIELSFWLLSFAIFLFLSLALVKRYVELDTVGVALQDEKRVMGRGYRYSDLDLLAQMGVASAFSATLVLALYVERISNSGLYLRPQMIWLVCPIVLYVISRIWFLAKRGEMQDDPVAWILRDWRSHLMGAIVAAIMIAATV